MFEKLNTILVDTTLAIKMNIKQNKQRDKKKTTEKQYKTN